MNQPTDFNSVESSFASLLQQAQAQSGTDLHIRVGTPPLWRIRGKLYATPYAATTEELFWQWSDELFDPLALQPFQQGSVVNQIVTYAGSPLAVYGHWTVSGPALNIRIPTRIIPDIAQLGLPQPFIELGQAKQGLILVAGVVGSGKSTSLVSLANHINKTTCYHMVTLEDPLWFVYPQEQAWVTQWVNGIHINGMVDGIVQAMQIDADVIVINEICDRPTLDKALQAAQSGRLVLACFNASRVIDTLQTIFSFYNDMEQSLIHHRLSKVLKGILAQRLVPTEAGHFRRAAIHDLLVVNAQAQRQLANGHIDQLADLMESDAELWPHTMRQDLQKLQSESRISEETFSAIAQWLDDTDYPSC